LDQYILKTKRSRRWNGTLDSLGVEFLTDVLEKMEAYGENVQFEFPGHAQRPNYQVINGAGKKMAFDKKNLLLRLNENGEVSDTLSPVFSLEAVKRALKDAATPARQRASRASTARVSGGARKTAAAAAPVDTVEHDKYAYYRSNRETLPEGIEKHSAAISELMRNGLSAEDAFNEIIKQHF
jgi:hypothetical protein